MGVFDTFLVLLLTSCMELGDLGTGQWHACYSAQGHNFSPLGLTCKENALPAVKQ